MFSVVFSCSSLGPFLLHTNSWLMYIPLTTPDPSWVRTLLLALVFTGFSHIILFGLLRWLSGKESACRFRRCRRHESIPRLARSPGKRNGNPLHYSCLGNPMDRGTWWTTIHQVTKVAHDSEGMQQKRACQVALLLSSFLQVGTLGALGKSRLLLFQTKTGLRNILGIS